MIAQSIQIMLNVSDYETIAHGYDMERLTLDIWFQDGQVIKQYKRLDDIVKTEKFEYFDWSELNMNVKRWYRDRTNTKLVELINTFGGNIALTG